MLYRLAIDAVAVTHLLFILFVIFGAALAWKRPVLRRLHWAALAYGLSIEVFNWYCPLTLLEVELRRQAGLSLYNDSFIAHYLRRIIYLDVPQWLLITGAAIVVGVNLGLYWMLSRRASFRGSQHSA